LNLDIFDCSFFKKKKNYKKSTKKKFSYPILSYLSISILMIFLEFKFAVPLSIEDGG